MVLVKKYESIIKKIIIVIIIFQNLFIPISNAAFWDDVIDSGDDFINKGTSEILDETTEVDQSKLDDTVDKVYNALLTLGIILSVLIGAILGIKFMTGSVEEQAKIKELLMPYVTGCIVTFGAFGIWKILMVVLSKV